MFRGNKDPVEFSFLENKDGFSTSGTILFYLDGMKEAQEGGQHKNLSRLIGPDEIEKSTTKESLTLLIDLESRSLVPHFAEIDYLDDERPLVIVQSARSLENNKHYAVALVDASDLDGNKLEPSKYLTLLLDKDQDNNLTIEEKQRALLYRETIIPSLHHAASWLGNKSEIQMLFDFHTESLESQVGITRKIVASSLSIVDDDEWGGWGDHNVRVTEIIDDDLCHDHQSPLGRIVHAEIDVPSFLMGGKGREKTLQMYDIHHGRTLTTLPVKILIIIPCSLFRGIQELRAVIDYGHGFMYSRKELLDGGSGFLHRLAEAQGYILFASNWRGMSHLDLGLLLRSFVAEPNVLQSIQANIMQGYGSKAAIQHFARTSLLTRDFMRTNFELSGLDQSHVRYVFYGISQGGILGSAYTTLMSRSGFLDGSIISSSGTPLSLLMSRSTIFKTYQTLLLMSLHNNRQVRIFVSFLQMIFDAVDGPKVGNAGKEESETGEFKTLIQAGLGDPVVTTIGTGKASNDIFVN